MKAYDIDWDVGLQDLIDFLEKTEEPYAVLDIPSYIGFCMLSDEEARDFAAEKLKENRWRIYEYMGLPVSDVDVPDDVLEDEAANYLSDKYGFRIKSLKLYD